MGLLRTLTASIGISLFLFCLGCGVVAIPLGTPSISQILPQTVAAGSKGMTMKVVGTNFTKRAVVLWNGNSLPTSVVDSNTLSASVQSSSLATPTVVQLQVQDVQTGKESDPVPLTVTDAASNGPAMPNTPALAISTASLPSGTIGAAYSTSLAATGGTPAYTWSVTSGQLPAGLSLSSAGIISGTPTAGGAASFGVTVNDAGSPAESATVVLTMSVNVQSLTSSPLAISSTALPGATATQSYKGQVSATGGTAPYTWSITSGQLPNGLSLAASTGVISGTPSVSNTFRFGISVTDSGSPAQTASTTVSITVAAGNTTSPLTIAAPTLPSGSDGATYSTTLQASGGTPAYTWSISSGSLPAGLTLGASTGVISGTPTATGTSNFTAMVSDNGNPEETQSVATSITVSAAQPIGPGTTWYVRTDGGTRYSSNMTAGQCDGKADVAYPGTGTNQHCAFGDVRWLWQDGSYNTSMSFPSWGWVIASGDTVIIRGSIGTGASWRVGWNNSWGALDSSGLYYGLQGDQYNSGIPVPPSGSASQHTRILGENYAACTSQSARTQLHGGWSVYTVLNLTGASYVDVGCLDITDFSNCGRDNDAIGCTDGQQDFARYGIRFSNSSTHDTLTDIRIHGMGSDGIYGPTGDGFVATDLAIIGNADAGWNTDAGDGATGVGSFLVQNFDISWNGCVEEYPIVDALPYFSCRDDSTGGYGDGFGTATVLSNPPGWQVHFDNGTSSYNTQDGLDAKHVSGTGSTMTITRTLAYGNEGQQLKVGDGAPATIQNSVIVGNCEALGQTIPGRPSPTEDYLGDLCRAANTAIVLDTTPGKPSVFQNNTIFTEGAVGLEVEYATSDFGPTNVLLYNNNVFYGFYNSYFGVNPAPIYSAGGVDGAGGSPHAIPAVLTNPGASWTHNSYMGQKGNWPCPQPGESAALCADPGLADETYHSYGYGNMKPVSGSSIIGAGVTIPSLTLDYTGQIRPIPPSIGAYE